jgi:hypothetical protein
MVLGMFAQIPFPNLFSVTVRARYKKQVGIRYTRQAESSGRMDER